MERHPSASPTSHCTTCKRWLSSELFKRRRDGGFYNTCSTCLEYRRNRRTVLGEIDVNALRQTRQSFNPSPKKRQRYQYDHSVALPGPVQPPEPDLEPVVPSRPLQSHSPLPSLPDLEQLLRGRTPSPPAPEQLLRSRTPSPPVPEPPQPRVRGRPRRQPLGFISAFTPGAPHYMGTLTEVCTRCLALHWPEERSMLCCKEGDLILEPFREPPAFLKNLLTGSDSRSRDFLTRIRQYNSALAFTSLSYNKDRRADELGPGLTCFSIHGNLYHMQGPLQPGSQAIPAFAQLFFYDPDYATTIRSDCQPELDRVILRELHTMLTGCNPFIRLYLTATECIAVQPAAFRLTLNPRMELVVEGAYHQGRINLPSSDEIAAIIPEETGSYKSRDIVLTSRNNAGGESNLTRIPVSHLAYMPLHYVLFFPYGDYGWGYNMELQGRRRGKRLTLQKWYQHRLHTRKDQFSSIFYGGRLFQQYIVDAFVTVETTRLDWHRLNQSKIQADLYQCVYDALHLGDANATDIGYRVILPSSFSGGDHQMQQLFQDVMALVCYFGKPTYFITMTANPNWPEIKENLLPGQSVADRPDLVACVFEGKRRQLINVLKASVLGPYGGHGFTIEYQKRGLPHIHFLFYRLLHSAELSPDNIDEVIYAEIPDPNHHPNSPCMKRKTPAEPLRCSKRFPKKFTDVTVMSEDGYPEYRRRNDGQSTVQAVKYIHKYVYKGHDRSTLAVRPGQNEIEQYVQARYVSPMEAFARLMEYKVHQEWPPVTRLPRIDAGSSENRGTLLVECITVAQHTGRDFTYGYYLLAYEGHSRLRNCSLQNMSFPLALQDPECDYGLYVLNEKLQDMQLTVVDFGLPIFSFNWSAIHDRTVPEYNAVEEAAIASTMQAQLNQDQRECFNTIITAIENKLQNAYFYLQGPGGSASTGIAALLLPAGRIAHSQFRIPIELNESSVNSILKNSKLATILRRVDLIIWDEVPMQHKYCFEVVHCLFCDLQSVEDQDLLFSRIPVILGGDFAQILLVVSGEGEADFVRWISSLPYDTALHGLVSIPLTISRPQNLEALLDDVYPLPLLQAAPRDHMAFRGRVLLTVRNETVRALNEMVMTRFPGFERTYLSVDLADVNDEDDSNHTQSASHVDSQYMPIRRFMQWHTYSCYGSTESLDRGTATRWRVGWAGPYDSSNQVDVE
ncbi:hypothetical protein B7463_g11855, partial [Scytalidium lignicola]